MDAAVKVISKDEMPVRSIAVVTLTKNDSANLRGTLASVRIQSHQEKEHLIYDGGSAEKQLSQIRRLGGQELIIEGGPDRGIFDGMNRAVQHTTADWILFLNSGDTFSAPDVLQRLAQIDLGEAGVLYGDHRTVFSEGTIWERRAAPLSELRRRIPFCHQASLTRRELLLQYPFAVGRLDSDFRFFHQLYSAGVPFCHVGFTIAEVTAGGISDRNRLRLVRENRETVKTFGKLTPELEAYYAKRFLIEVLRMGAKEVFRGSAQNRLRRISHWLHERKIV